MYKIIFGFIAALIFIGCASDTLTITKCKSYKNGICITKEVKQVKKCKNPTKIDNEIYCEE